MHPPEVPDYLLRTAFVFDDFRLVYAPVPKAGSTAILGALAEVVGLKPEDFARSRKLEVTRALTVHDGSLWGPSYRLEGRSSKELERILRSDGWFRLAVVREPARRLWSAWVSKVLVRDPRFVAAFGEDWFPTAPSSAEDVLEAFREFIRALPKQPDWHDPHWSAQADLIGAEDVAYDHIGRIEELDRTAVVIATHLESSGYRLPALRPENPSILPFAPGLFGRRALDACNRWTARDRDAFGYEPLATDVDEPGDEWHAAVEAIIPAIRAVIERNERIGDLRGLLEGSNLRTSARRRLRGRTVGGP